MGRLRDALMRDFTKGAEAADNAAVQARKAWAPAETAMDRAEQDTAKMRAGLDARLAAARARLTGRGA
jgi:hypothetical protein